MTNLEKLYREVAAETGEPLAEVERMCRFQFLFNQKQIGSGNYQTVRFPLLGSFMPIPFLVKRQQERKEEKQIKENFQAFGHHAY